MTGGTGARPGLRVLLRGPYPPPYGGVASLMVSLVPGLMDGRADEVAVLHYGNENSTKFVGGTTIYSFAVKSQVWRVLLPQNWSLFVFVLLTLRSARLRFKELLFETVKAILANQVAVRHDCNVVSFYQADVALELLACKRKWGCSRGIVLKVFGEIYDAPEFVRSRVDLFRALLTTPDAVSSSSVHCAKSWRSLGIDRQIEVIYVGVDLERFQDDGTLREQFRNQLKVDESAPVLLFMGRFNSQMGLDGLITLIPGLVRRGGEFRIILAGAKGDLTPLATECQIAHPDHVIVMNDVPSKVLPSLYAAADIVLVPSRDQHACMGVTIKEAMAASRAVIGTDSGGIPEAIVHDETGLVVPLAADGGMDIPAFEAAILSLMADRQRRLEMGRKARMRAEALFSERVTIERTADLFSRCMPRA